MGGRHLPSEEVGQRLPKQPATWGDPRKKRSGGAHPDPHWVWIASHTLGVDGEPNIGCGWRSSRVCTQDAASEEIV
eukprot:355265-Chlamydomonas_euryale.AAC.9